MWQTAMMNLGIQKIPAVPGSNVEAPKKPMTMRILNITKNGEQIRMDALRKIHAERAIEGQMRIDQLIAILKQGGVYTTNELAEKINTIRSSTLKKLNILYETGIVDRDKIKTENGYYIIEWSLRDGS